MATSTIKHPTIILLVTVFLGLIGPWPVQAAGEHTETVAALPSEVTPFSPGEAAHKVERSSERALSDTRVHADLGPAAPLRAMGPAGVEALRDVATIAADLRDARETGIVVPAPLVYATSHRAVANAIRVERVTQESITGRVVDNETGDGLPGATVVLEEHPNVGAVTDLNGNFELSNVEPGEYRILVSFIGYAERAVAVTVASGESTSVGDIVLSPTDIGLEEIQVLASTARQRETPVAFSSVQADYIETRIGTKDLPEVLDLQPGVFTTKSGGGYGDASISVRGFGQENVAVLINGVPVNDPTRGNVFWSNWAGLGDVTREIEVQRGLGATEVAINSIGGTINIITKTSDMERGGRISSSVGHDNFLKNQLTLSSGLTDSGWAFTFSGSRTTGEGYVDAAYIDAWSYFLSVSKDLGNHQLLFTGIGAPQSHGQRQTRLPAAQFEDHPRGIRYNSAWGYLDGEQLNIENNWFHKPHFTLNHYWEINDRNFLSTAAYLSTGSGGASAPFGNANIDRLSNGQIDFESIRDFNRGRLADNDGNLNEPDDQGRYESQYFLINFTNSHWWTGFISRLDSELREGLDLTIGTDVKLSKTTEASEIRNLLGGDYAINWFDVNNPGEEVGVGDGFLYDNDNYANWFGIFGQLQRNFEPFHAYIGGTVSTTAYKRVDRFTYEDGDPMQETDWEYFPGFDIKGGINYNIDERNNIFVNSGYYSRVPFHWNVFVDFTNEMATDINNEQIIGLEAGYGYQTNRIALNLDLYNTIWRDKQFLVGVTEPDGTTSFANMPGLSAVHRGVELEIQAQVSSRLSMSGMASIGDWKWSSDVEATYANQDRSEVTEVQVYADGLRVGDAAQTRLAASADYDLGSGFDMGTSVRYNDRIFAQFDPVGRTDPTSRQNSWQLPAYTLVDMYLGYNFEIGTLGARLDVNVYNLFDSEHITGALDGPGHTRDAARVFYGFGRHAVGSLTVDF